MNPDKTRWVVWSAVSSLPQLEGYSLDEQQREGRGAATRWGGDVVAVLSVDGDSRDIVELSEARQRIPEYDQLYSLIAARTFDVLVFRDMSRLGRDPALSLQISSLCRRAKIILYDLEAPPATLDFSAWDVSAEYIRAIRAVQSQDETQRLRSHNRKGMIRRVEAGNFPGRVPWGWIGSWDTTGRKPRLVAKEIDPEAQRVLRILIDRYLTHGEGLRTVAQHLNALGLSTSTGVPWSKASLQQIANRMLRYAGITELNKNGRTDRPYVRAKSKWPALITEAEAQAVLDERKRRAEARPAVESGHLFSQCVWCAVCERRMIAYYATAINKYNSAIRYRTPVLRCNHPTSSRQAHAGGYISAWRVREAVADAIRQIADPEFLSIVLASTPSAAATTQNEIADLERQRTRHEAARQRANTAYTDGLMDQADYRAQVERLRGLVDACNVQIADLQDAARHEAKASERPARLRELGELGLAMLDDDDVPRANAWLRQHIRVYVRDNRVQRVEFL